MDTGRGFGEDRFDANDEAHDASESGVGEAQAVIGNDERRMHVRAYNHWVSLLRGRAYPSIEDLDPANIADFGPHSVLLDFSRGIEDPAIAFLGRALRDETGLDATITHISQVPGRSLLSRLTDHYLQIIANRAPIGFEAEFVGTRGHNTMYRGILMPFSSDEDTIDFIYGVINWKELVDAETQAKITAELEEARRTAPRPIAPAPVWADGPSAGIESAEDHEEPVAEVSAHDSLADQLALAQQTAAAVRAADTRSRAALYRALGRAHDFAEATEADREGYEALLEAAGIAAQARAPLTPVVKLVFGADYDKTRVTEFAAVLGHARRNRVPVGGLGDFLEGFEGGIKAVVKAERALRKPAAVPAPSEDKLADRTPIATLALDTGVHEGELVLLVARAHGDALDILASVANDAALTARAVRAVR